MNEELIERIGKLKSLLNEAVGHIGELLEGAEPDMFEDARAFADHINHINEELDNG